jgi:hypothetical protein
MTDIFYHRGPDGEFETYEIEEDARNEAEALLEQLQDEAIDNGWHENMGDLEWGRLIPLCECVQGPERPSDNPDFAYICDYSLKDLPDPYAALQKRVAELETAAWALLDAISNEQTTEAACEGGIFDVLNDMAVYYKDIKGEIVTLESLLPPREPTNA